MVLLRFLVVLYEALALCYVAISIFTAISEPYIGGVIAFIEIELPAVLAVLGGAIALELLFTLARSILTSTISKSIRE